MKKKCSLDIMLRTKSKDRKSEPIIRVSPEIYQILKDFSFETGLSLKEFTEILLKFSLEHINVSYAEE